MTHLSKSCDDPGNGPKILKESLPTTVTLLLKEQPLMLGALLAVKNSCGRLQNLNVRVIENSLHGALMLAVWPSLLIGG